MVLLVKLFSIVIIIYGCLLMLRPGMMKQILGYVKEGNRLYVSGGIKAGLGLILMLAASSCRIPWIVLFLGALSVFSGAATFLIKKEVMIRFIDWWETKNDRYVYLVGTIVLFIGILLALAT